jgi:transposase
MPAHQTDPRGGTPRVGRKKAPGTTTAETPRVVGAAEQGRLKDAREAGVPWKKWEAAHGAARTKNKYFQALYHRLAARRGKQRALVAVGHSLLVTGYYLITRQTKYEDLGGNYFDERDREAVKRRAVKRLEKLGYQVQLVPAAVSTG